MLQLTPKTLYNYLIYDSFHISYKSYDQTESEYKEIK